MCMYLIKEPEVAQFFICTVRGGFSQTRQPDEFRRDDNVEEGEWVDGGGGNQRGGASKYASVPRAAAFHWEPIHLSVLCASQPGIHPGSEILLFRKPHDADAVCE